MQELFGEGWREPGDDCERLMYLLIMGLGFPMGALFALAPLLEEIRRPSRAHAGLLALGAPVGLALLVGTAVFFRREVRHWDLRRLTAERVVAGGFVLGFALMLLGLRFPGMAAHSGARGGATSYLAMFGLMGVGVLVLFLSLAAGLVFAYAPALARSRTFVATAEGRYAVDDKLGEWPDHPCPVEDGLRAIVVLVAAEGRRALPADPGAYALADPGRRGRATVRRGRLLRFRPEDRGESAPEDRGGPRS